MKAAVKQVNLTPDDLCPCESGRLLRECCLSATTLQMRKQIASLIPPTPATGYSQPGCYLNYTHDCSADLSSEHYVSRTVLELIGDRVVSIDGAPWLPAGERREIGINNLAANILCRRHNAALAPLDDAVGTFAQRFRRIVDDSGRKSLSRKNSLTLVSGEGLELWMLKLACGLFYSKNAAKEGARLIDDHTIDENSVEAAFFQRRWGAGCGLYIRAPEGYEMSISNTIAMAPLMVSLPKRVAGVRCIMMGLDFQLIFDATGGNVAALASEGWTHRPSEIVIQVQKRAYTLHLTWEPGTPVRSIRMTARRPSQ